MPCILGNTHKPTSNATFMQGGIFGGEPGNQVPTKSLKLTGNYPEDPQMSLGNFSCRNHAFMVNKEISEIRLNLGQPFFIFFHEFTCQSYVLSQEKSCSSSHTKNCDLTFVLQDVLVTKLGIIHFLSSDRSLYSLLTRIITSVSAILLASLLMFNAPSLFEHLRYSNVN